MANKQELPKIYFGAGLFTEADRNFNAMVVEAIRENNLGDVYSPAENMSINDKSNYADSTMIYQGDNDKLEESDIMIAVLDGDVIDSGLACEVGWFSRMAETSDKPKKIIGLFTDIRQGDVTSEKVGALEEIAESPFLYVNLYVVGAIKTNGVIVSNTDDLLKEIKNFG